MALELYDLMAEDHEIFCKKQSNGEIHVLVINEDEGVVYEESSHLAAWDSLVYFAKQVISEHERMEKEHD